MQKVGVTRIRLAINYFIVFTVALVMVTLILSMVVSSFLRSNEAPRRVSCQNNLKQMGLVYKMYAAENRDELFPPISLRGFEKVGGGLHMTFNFGPNMEAIYPEYLTDPNILVCPTDPNASIDYLVSDSRIHREWQGSEEGWVEWRVPGGTWELNEWRSPDEGGPLTLNGLPCTDPRACIHAVDNSYWYWGYVFDKLDDEHGLAPVNRLSEGMSAHGVSPHSGDGPAQLVQAFEEILLERALPALAAGDLEALNLAAHADVPVTLGNADTETVHRLREGVERFFITDTENPRAAAAAQAQIAVMFDAMGVSALDRGTISFNHKEGGSNVLFMDGHVEFVPYKERPPVTDSVADFAAAVLRD